MTATRTALRKQLRARRRALDEAARHDAAAGLLRVAATSAAIRRSRHIAFYLPNDGEQDILPVLERAWAQHKYCYLPVLDGPKPPRLRFARYEPGDPLSPNRFGIPEPCLPARECIGAAALDLVLMPLVAFDEDGNRLGMGGGFYDRTLAFLRHRRYWRRPRCYGVAFEFQRIDRIAPEPWDAPLDGCLTDAREYRFPGVA